MNRRHFVRTMGSAAAAASLLGRNAFGSGMTTNLYARGLILVSFEHPDVLRLGFPEAPAHRATLIAVPRRGSRREIRLKGPGSVHASASGVGRRNYRIPELILMQELYGAEIRSRIEECPVTLSIPYGAIQSIAAGSVTLHRYRFVRGDNGREISTFRPRHVAETLKIELLSEGILELDRGRTRVALDATKELHAEYSPTSAPPPDMDAFTAHFPHYMAYMERPKDAGFDAIPVRLGGTAGPAAGKSIGHHFARIFPFQVCFVVGV